jgi:hypothetical protein
MNELVTPERGLLVAYTSTGTMGHANTYHFDEAAMAQTVEKALGMSDEELRAKGDRARQWFTQNHAEFAQRVGKALAELKT